MLIDKLERLRALAEQHKELSAALQMQNRVGDSVNILALIDMLEVAVKFILDRRDNAHGNMEGTDGLEFKQWSDLWAISSEALAKLEKLAGGV